MSEIVLPFFFLRARVKDGEMAGCNACRTPIHFDTVKRDDVTYIDVVIDGPFRSASEIRPLLSVGDSGEIVSDGLTIIAQGPKDTVWPNLSEIWRETEASQEDGSGTIRRKSMDKLALYRKVARECSGEGCEGRLAKALAAEQAMWLGLGECGECEELEDACARVAREAWTGQRETVSDDERDRRRRNALARIEPLEEMAADADASAAERVAAWQEAEKLRQRYGLLTE